MKNFLHWYPAVMTLTVSELDARMETLREGIRTDREALLALTNDQGAKMEDIRAKKQVLDDKLERLSLMENQRAAMVEQAKNSLGGKAPQAKMTVKEAAGAFYRAALTDTPAAQMAYEQLGAIPAENADQGHGSRLMPTTLVNDLLLEPEIENPLRPFMTVTNVVGLELPKLDFTAENDDFDKDGATAKELEMDSGNIQFGRHKLHLIAHVSESLLRTTPLNIERAVASGLESAMMNKELKVMFAATPATGEEYMSFYSTQNGIETVNGETMLDAIIAAYADLEDRYRQNARVVMSYAAYAAMIRTLANSESLFSRKPEEILGIPVVFCDRATKPVVGDFRYCCLNFDTAPWFDTDKDLTHGNRLFDVTAQYDIKLRMSAAFRLAAVGT